MIPKRKWATLAWGFKSPLNQFAMKQRLDEVSEKPWGWGESDYNGDYIAGRVTPEAAGRIYLVDGAFVMELHFVSKADQQEVADAQLAKAKDRLVNELLPLVQAVDPLPRGPVG